MIVTVAFLVVVAYAALCLRHLHRACKAVDRRREAWKDYAVALEVVYDCQWACEDDRKDAKVMMQADNAASAAATAATTLFALGEYPDAYGCCPFLPYRN
jgi:hypothetical protein